MNCPQLGRYTFHYGRHPWAKLNNVIADFIAIASAFHTESTDLALLIENCKLSYGKITEFNETRPSTILAEQFINSLEIIQNDKEPILDAVNFWLGYTH